MIMCSWVEMDLGTYDASDHSAPEPLAYPAAFAIGVQRAAVGVIDHRADPASQVAQAIPNEEALGIVTAARVVRGAPEDARTGRDGERATEPFTERAGGGRALVTRIQRSDHRLLHRERAWRAQDVAQ